MSIVVVGGTKGGVGKTTLATNLAVMRSLAKKDVLLIDADEQGSAADFTAVRNETVAGGAGYTAVKLYGAAVRSEVLRLASKHDDVVIDVGGRDTAGQRAALSIADIYLIPIFPGSFDIWTLEPVAQLVIEARAFNEKIQACCLLNKADPKGADNEEAAAIAKETPGLTYLDCPIVNRKAFRNGAAKGLAVVELKPSDSKAIEEINRLYTATFDIQKVSK
ncbi:AAA family ATPase [Leptolyngbya sp. GB1-A1]|uniref:nucleotide-binding protein n=1 Tax=Leptolyngbya sp. GB1-A1 TaxID=2933908 RepID=UPI003297C577